jgi:hypothetical protein
VEFDNPIIAEVEVLYNVGLIAKDCRLNLIAKQ